VPNDLQTMVRRIRTDINRGSAHDTRIKEAIVDAIKRFRGKRLGFNQKISETVLISDQEVVALPVDWMEADFLRLEVDQDRYPLREVAYDTIEEKQRGLPTTGMPRDYAIQHRQLRFYPIPDQSYTLVFSFQFDLPEVSVSASDAATNAWMDEGEELIRKQATGDLFVSYIGGDKKQDGALLLSEVENAILPSLETRAAREQSSGSIRAFL
jgi:hypothetical protein